MENNNINHRITQKEKEKNKKEYYRNVLDSISLGGNNTLFSFEDSNITRLKVNYDLYNNIIDINEFNYVCKPFGDKDVGELPANMVNRDIVSGKIKAVESMEITEPFDFSIIATNPEATTRKEQEVFGRLLQHVHDSIMQPIVAQLEQQAMESLQGQELDEEGQQELQAQLQQQIEENTPDEIAKYMAREHQDPAEMLATHLLNYLTLKEEFKRKTNLGWKHSCLSAHEIYYIGQDAQLQPTIEVINPMEIIYSPDSNAEFIEDLDMFATERKMTTTQLISMFGNELTDEEVDKLYEENSQFAFDQKTISKGQKFHTVVHANWVGLRKVGFLLFVDESGNIQERIVDESYVMEEEKGDLEILWQWIPETHEGYKINEDMYKRCQPVIGQIIDIDNLYTHKLNYCGAIYDNLNSEPTSLMDRMKHYQYYYNIIMYRIEQLMASDKGKIMMFNINAIPKSAGIDLDKFLYYAEALKIGFFNPNEEGNRGDSNSVSNIAKEVDMSLASDIQKYIGLADYMERRCGESVGINKNIEGQTPHNEAVGNAQMNFNQAAGILQTYYDLHNIVKKNLLTMLLEKAKALYSINPTQKKLQYILDDLSLAMFEIDFELLDNSVYGIFLTNSVASKQAKQAVQQLAQAALQNDKANLKVISKVIRATSIQEAEELMELADREAHEREMQLEEMRNQSAKEAREAEAAFEKERMAHEEKMIILKETERRETEIQKQLILSMGFNEDKDMDKDKEPDILEIAKRGIDADIKIRGQELKEKALKHKIETDAQNIAIRNQYRNNS